MPLSITPGPILSTHSIILIYTSVRLVHKKNGATVEEEVREKKLKKIKMKTDYFERESFRTRIHTKARILRNQQQEQQQQLWNQTSMMMVNDGLIMYNLYLIRYLKKKQTRMKKKKQSGECNYVSFDKQMKKKIKNPWFIYKTYAFVFKVYPKIPYSTWKIN